MSQIQQLLQKIKIPILQSQINQFESLLKLFISWNKKLNLSAIRDPQEIIIKHFIDSIYIIKFIDFTKITNIIDIGSGGGFPALPLAIMFPHLQITICDSVQKKITTVENICQKLKLENIKCIAARAEELGQNQKYREKYDLVTARAVASLPTLLEYLSPFCKINNTIATFKKAEYQLELDSAHHAISLLSLKIDKIEKYQLPQTMGQRSIIFFNKIKKLNLKYPRQTGLPKKKPLI